jgi:hypothetical protein
MSVSGVRGCENSLIHYTRNGLNLAREEYMPISKDNYFSLGVINGWVRSDSVRKLHFEEHPQVVKENPLPPISFNGLVGWYVFRVAVLSDRFIRL